MEVVLADGSLLRTGHHGIGEQGRGTYTNGASARIWTDCSHSQPWNRRESGRWLMPAPEILRFPGVRIHEAAGAISEIIDQLAAPASMDSCDRGRTPPTTSPCSASFPSTLGRALDWMQEPERAKRRAMASPVWRRSLDFRPRALRLRSRSTRPTATAARPSASLRKLWSFGRATGSTWLGRVGVRRARSGRPVDGKSPASWTRSSLRPTCPAASRPTKPRTG